MRGTIPGSIPIAVLDQAGRKVTRIEPDEEGDFCVDLQVGTYTLAPEIQESIYLVLPGERRSRFASLPQRNRVRPQAATLSLGRDSGATEVRSRTITVTVLPGTGSPVLMGIS